MNEIMLKISMYGMFVFGSLTALSAFGWNYFGLKVKQQEKSETVQKKTDTVPKVQNSYQIQGDYIKGNKLIKKEKLLNAPNALIVTQDQKGGQNTVNQFYGTKDPNDIVLEPTFDASGLFGLNVLSNHQSIFKSGEQFSFSAKIPEHSSFKVIVTVNPIAAGSSMGFKLGTGKNWNMITSKQGYFELLLSDGDTKGDYSIILAGSAIAQIQMFLNDKPFSQKTISWN